ncbi:tetratricopeptide repeat protein [Novispirillum sp. DQ9]|uniref:tetratricopeptide repeat protein n=1 Tax=Novispirillum sp. DQ9 TaxID=3398612 RepID=UPI003C7984A3
MPGLPSRPFLPLLLAGMVAACGPHAPQETPPQRMVEMGGSGPGRSAREAVAVPSAKPARPTPPPAKPAEAAALARGTPANDASDPDPSVAPPRSAAEAARAAQHPAEPPRGRGVAKAEPTLEVAALPPSLSGVGGLPSDPVEITRLRTRPPMTPPVDTAFDAAMDRATASSGAPTAAPTTAPPPGSAAATGGARCREAVRAARESVNHYLTLPVERIAETTWVEDALRVTEVAVRACQGQPNEEAAIYWRATAFFLHGQYARAALNFRRVADVDGAFNALGYAANLATLLQACGDDRASLDAFRLGGLYEAAGHPERAATQYTQAARSACVPLRDTAEARLRVIAERLSRGAAAR